MRRLEARLRQVQSTVRKQTWKPSDEARQHSELDGLQSRRHPDLSRHVGAWERDGPEQDNLATACAIVHPTAGVISRSLQRPSSPSSPFSHGYTRSRTQTSESLLLSSGLCNVSGYRACGHRGQSTSGIRIGVRSRHYRRALSYLKVPTTTTQKTTNGVHGPRA